MGLGIAAPLVLIPAILSLCVAIIATICLVFPRTRKDALLALAYSLVWFGAAKICVWTGDMIRIHAFLELSERSTPIVDAIRAYETKNGSPPDRFEQLVPEYLPTIPATGMRAYPTYQLYVSKAPSEINGNPWMLSVFTPRSGN